MKKKIQNFVKLFLKIMLIYMYHCTFRPRNTFAENVTEISNAIISSFSI